MKRIQLLAYASLPFWLAGCALTAPPETVSVQPPNKWFAPLPTTPTVDKSVENLPHGGTLTDLSKWWEQQNDPVLVELIQSAETVSPTVATAVSRIEQSRATSVSTGAVLGPKLDVTASSQRSNMQAPLPLGTTTQAALQPSWEIDVFGANRATSRAAQARLQGAQANWHDARVSVAAEVANRYYSLRTCNKLEIVTRADADSRAETARLSELSAKAGFQAPATAALARASAAEGNGRATQQSALCDLDVKALVYLTAMDEPTLRNKLANSSAPPVSVTLLNIDSLPAQTLSQRPDIFIAEREVAAASAEVGSAQAQRYPRLSLSGSIGAGSFRSAGTTTNMNTWSVGPLSLSLPIFDGGTRVANIDAAKARYEEAVVNYRASVRQAVREVEEALVNLQSTASRSEDARVAVEGYRASFNGTQSLYQNGLASLIDLEDLRRTRLAAELNAATLERERMSAWIALYRAAGGGWVNPQSTAATATK
ncbi:efflux transporter outer membrane subunit [Herminiimonas arsenitoxidans]|uniref:efflux transporter outer membrane subunit n=1 Tax=Herminiimonas arsenitoxidans TaxID=1809410 RepID=UPI0009704E6E|nr:efflux transporter outer membrane subunit [Herminiimonas arsenitoxidans]